jgi:GNAT superfamily N-acetyltransferase
MNATLPLLDTTWPAAACCRVGAFTVREGRGGGSRVSAATLGGSFSDADISAVEAAQRALNQPPLFMILDGQEALDSALDARGYRIKDPVAIYAAPTARLAKPAPDPMTAFAIWPPLEIMRDVWAEGDIGPARIAIMDRALGPKTAIMGRIRDRVSGVAFVATDGARAMLHALHVTPGLRRQGSAVNIMRTAAMWAQDQGASELFLAVTTHNQAANTLYASLGMQIVENYHYRSL